MMMWANFVLACVVLFGYTHSSPLLFNAPSITSLLSASSSQPQSNVANLQASKQRRVEKLDSDREIPSFFQNDNTEEPPPNMANDVIPALLQKKLSKLLFKLQFLSSLSGNGNVNTDEADGGGNDGDNDDGLLLPMNNGTDGGVIGIDVRSGDGLSDVEKNKNEQRASQLGFQPSHIMDVFANLVKMAQKAVENFAASAPAGQQQKV